MKRFRLSTLLLLIVVAAQGAALVVQHQRHQRQLAEMGIMFAASQWKAESDKTQQIIDDVLTKMGQAATAGKGEGMAANGK